MTDWPTYTCEYQFDGSTWCFHVKAQSHDDARRRVRAIGLTGVVRGELHSIIPATPGVGIAVRLSCWFRNIARAFR